jgi:putative ABC transport system substrate-binding protein
MPGGTVMTRRFIFIAFLAVLVAFVGNSAPAQAGKKVIFVFTWRGCEEACRGFKDYIVEKKIDAEIIVRDAGRDKSKLAGFQEEARSRKADLIVSWGTSVTLGTAGRLDDVNNPRFNNDIPQVFMIVADPVGARVVKSLENTGRKNVTGTFNRVPEVVNINTIRSYMPTFKTLGLLYNKNEKNSALKHAEISKLAIKMNFKLVALEMPLDPDGKPRKVDIPVKMAELKKNGVDFIYLGSSSFLDTNRDAFTGSAVENGIPVLSPYERLVRDSHALLSISARYNEVGRLAGRQAEKILVEGMTPGDIPVLRMTKFAYVVNMEVAKRLNLFPPIAVLEFAETVK